MRPLIKIVIGCSAHVVFLTVVLIMPVASGQVLQSGSQGLPSGSNEDLSIYGTDVTEFTWIRGRYTNHGGGRRGRGGRGFGRRGGWWDTAYPDSDENFLR